MTLDVGDELPDVPLLSPTGAPTSLSTFRGEAAVLIFLRHLG